MGNLNPRMEYAWIHLVLPVDGKLAIPVLLFMIFYFDGKVVASAFVGLDSNVYTEIFCTPYVKFDAKLLRRRVVKIFYIF